MRVTVVWVVAVASTAVVMAMAVIVAMMAWR